MTNAPTQADREAAAAMWIAANPDRPASANWNSERMNCGSADKGPVVQALRAHRLATLDAAIEVVREDVGLRGFPGLRKSLLAKFEAMKGGQ